MHVDAAGPDSSGLWRWRVETAFKLVIEYSPFALKWQFHLPVPGELWVDSFPQPGDEADGLRVLLLCEPNAFRGLRWRAIHRQREFDYILTFDPWVRRLCPNAVLFPYGTAWVTQPPESKVFGVSTVVGYKRHTKLHRARRRLWDIRHRFTVPTRFYVSGNRANLDFPDDYQWILKDDKLPLFETMFHIVIENARQRDYFTEKIIDCFATETVPIYIGCTNISDYFNQDGVLEARDLNDVVRIANSVTPDTYHQMREAIVENARRARKWFDLEKRLQAQLRSLARRRRPLLCG